MRAGFEVFRAFEQDAADFSKFAETKLLMPMLVLTARRLRTSSRSSKAASSPLRSKASSSRVPATG
jgi:hypothetical protein